MNDQEPALSDIPQLWISQGRIITEIEALAVLAGVEALPMAAGGINGAEGATWFLAWGDEAMLDRCRAIVDSVQGEPPFHTPGQ